MGNKEASPAIIAIAVVVLLVVLGGVGWFFMKPQAANPSKPPDFIDPATGRPRGVGAPNAGGAGTGSGMSPSPIGQSSRRGGYRPGGYPGR